MTREIELAGDDISAIVLRGPAKPTTADLLRVARFIRSEDIHDEPIECLRGAELRRAHRTAGCPDDRLPCEWYWWGELRDDGLAGCGVEHEHGQHLVAAEECWAWVL